MRPLDDSLWLEVDQVGDTTVVRFRVQRLLKERTVETIGDQLSDLVETQGRRRLVLNFGNVEAIASTILGKVVSLHEKAQAAGGKLVLCNIEPGVYEIFETLNLPQRLSICPGEQEALGSF
jgi:anti-sigma B factor antagonist